MKTEFEVTRYATPPFVELKLIAENLDDVAQLNKVQANCIVHNEETTEFGRLKSLTVRPPYRAIRNESTVLSPQEGKK